MNISKKNYNSFLESSVGCNSSVIVYGCGMCAYYIARDLLTFHKNISIECFAVSDKELHTSEFFGIPVLPIDYVDNINLKVLIGTLRRTHNEIINTLTEIGFTDIYAVDDEEYYNIRSQNPDNDAHIFRYITHSEEIFREMAYNGVFYTKYRAFHEKNYRDDFAKLCCREDYSHILSELTSNLDYSSKQEVFRIINRLMCLCEGLPIEYSREEKDQIRDLRENFSSQVYNVGCNIIYKDFILPCGIIVEPSVFYYKNGFDKIDNKKYLKGKAIIDAGAYIGDTALVLRRELNEKIYSFEFDAKNIQLFKNVMDWNNLENVEIVDMAIAEKSKVQNFYMGVGDSCDYNSIYKHNFGSYESEIQQVKCISIDEFVEKNGLKVGLIKSDIEGAEKQLILGAVKTIKEQHPVLIISIYHSIEDFFTLKPLIEKIYDGYKMKIFRPVLEHSFLEETVLICEPKEQYE